MTPWVLDKSKISKLRYNGDEYSPTGLIRSRHLKFVDDEDENDNNDYLSFSNGLNDFLWES